MKVLFKYESIGKQADNTRLKWILLVGFVVATLAVIFQKVSLMILAVVVVALVLSAKIKTQTEAVTTSFIATEVGLEIYQDTTDEVGEPLLLAYEDVFVCYFVDKRCTSFFISFYASDDEKNNVTLYVPPHSELQKFLLTDASELINIRQSKSSKKLSRRHRI